MNIMSFKISLIKRIIKLYNKTSFNIKFLIMVMFASIVSYFCGQFTVKILDINFITITTNFNEIWVNKLLTSYVTWFIGFSFVFLVGLIITFFGVIFYNLYDILLHINVLFNEQLKNTLKLLYDKKLSILK